MDVYVAGRTSAVPRVRAVQQMFTSKGHQIAFDWTRTKEEGGEGGIQSDWSDDPSRAQEIAQREVDACLTADLVVVLFQQDGLGMHYETAFAMVGGADIWVVGCPRDSVFFYLHDGIKRFEHESELVIPDPFTYLRS